MPRDYKVYLSDILEAILKIRQYAKDQTLETLMEDAKTFDAIVRNLEIIGEAVKHLPERDRRQHPGVDWKKIAGLRDILAHEYFGVDAEIVWDIVGNKLEPLETIVRQML